MTHTGGSVACADDPAGERQVMERLLAGAALAAGPEADDLQGYILGARLIGGGLLAALLAVYAAQGTLPALASPAPSPAACAVVDAARPLETTEREMLDALNRYRTELGLPPFQVSPSL